jgi:hypothetical protein
VTELTIIVPTRSRPANVERVIDAWDATGAFIDGAELLFVVDGDDPEYLAYCDVLGTAARAVPGVTWSSVPAWEPLVPKLNLAALRVLADVPGRFAVGFAGDDHLPRTPGWVSRYLEILREVGTGVVSCPDGYRPDDLPTQWAMTSDIVRALGRMVPAPVDHLYCDDAVRALGVAAECYHYLPDVLIEHMHPVAGKAGRDEQYDRVNSRTQYRGDRRAYHQWREQQLVADAQTVRTLIDRQGVQP